MAQYSSGARLPRATPGPWPGAGCCALGVFVSKVVGRERVEPDTKLYKG